MGESAASSSARIAANARRYGKDKFPGALSFFASILVLDRESFECICTLFCLLQQ